MRAARERPAGRAELEAAVRREVVVREVLPRREDLRAAARAVAAEQAAEEVADQAGVRRRNGERRCRENRRNQEPQTSRHRHPPSSSTAETVLTLFRDRARTITLKGYAVPSFEGLSPLGVKRANEGADLLGSDCGLPRCLRRADRRRRAHRAQPRERVATISSGASLRSRPLALRDRRARRLRASRRTGRSRSRRSSCASSATRSRRACSSSSAASSPSRRSRRSSRCGSSCRRGCSRSSSAARCSSRSCRTSCAGGCRSTGSRSSSARRGSRSARRSSSSSRARTRRAGGRCRSTSRALGAQFLFDYRPARSSCCARRGRASRRWRTLRSVLPAFAVDTLLAPLGLLVAFASYGHPWALLLVLPVLLLFSTFARERQRRIDNALELSSAYRGTAMLLGDVIEADDEYTGSHSRDVVDLVVSRRRPARARRARAAAGGVRGAPARRRQGEDPRRDHPQARARSTTTSGSS